MKQDISPENGRSRKTAKEKRIAEFKQALKEAKEMEKNIAAGNNRYETMDEFLERLYINSK
jgi:hypothetical protein